MKETKIKLKIVVLFVITALIITLPEHSNQKTSAGETGKVSFSVEKFTIGQGFVLEPEVVDFTGETTVAEIVDQTFRKKGIEYTMSTAQGTVYISGIKNADSGKVDIPSVISEMEPYQIWGTDRYIYAPANDVNDGNESMPDLVEFAYNSMAGWMFTVNGKAAPTAMEDTVVRDGDVVRIQFSVYGYGADLGIAYDTPEYPASPANLKLPDRTELISMLAAANTQKYLTFESCKEAYDCALAAAASYSSTQQDITDAAVRLNERMQDCDAVWEKMTDSGTQHAPTVPETAAETTSRDATTAAATTGTEAAKISMGKPKVKIRKVKRKKIKITLVKVDSVTGYQIKYAASPKFKKAKTVSTKKLTYTIKNLKKGTKYYLKARAYKIVNQKRIYSRWSPVKKVKLKK